MDNIKCEIQLKIKNGLLFHFSTQQVLYIFSLYILKFVRLTNRELGHESLLHQYKVGLEGHSEVACRGAEYLSDIGSASQPTSCVQFCTTCIISNLQNNKIIISP